MLAASGVVGADLYQGSSLVTKAINLRASDGDVVRVQLLLTPDVSVAIFADFFVLILPILEILACGILEV